MTSAKTQAKKQPVKIRRMIDAIPDTAPKWFCGRCKNPLKTPLEEEAVYVAPKKGREEPMLVCPGCVKKTDLYIWGNESVLG
jgi:hypothetical protein